MAKQTESIFTNPILRWIDDRFPLSSLIKDHATEYYASKNFNIWYLFGVLSMVVLIIMLITGFFLTMNYKPSADDAFNSVEYIRGLLKMVGSFDTCIRLVLHSFLSLYTYICSEQCYMDHIRNLVNSFGCLECCYTSV